MSLLSTSEILILVLLTVIWAILWPRRNLYYHAWKIPGPPAFPIIGNIYYFFGSSRDILPKGTRLMQKYKGISKIWMGNQLAIAVTKPEYLQLGMKNSLEKGQTYRFVKEILKNGVSTAPVELWRKNRRIIAPVFNQKTVDTFLSIFIEHSKILLQKLSEMDNGKFFNINPLLNYCTMDMICEFALGVHVDSLNKGNEYTELLHRLVKIPYKRTFNLFLHPDWIWRRTKLGKEFEFLTRETFKYVLKVIEDRKKRKNEENNSRPVLLDHLIELADSEWPASQLMEEVQTIMIAGSETTATTLSFCVLLLGMYKTCQSLVLAELRTVFGTSSRDPTIDDLSRLEYLERVIKETMRLFPVLMVIGRTVTRDTPVGPYTLPKGAELVIPILIQHRDPTLFPEPLKFDPDRFLPEAEAKRDPYSYIPFSAGTRNCLGWRYAMLDMKVVLSTIFRRYAIETRDFKAVEDIELQSNNIVATSIKGYYVSLKKLQNA